MSAAPTVEQIVDRVRRLRSPAARLAAAAALDAATSASADSDARLAVNSRLPGLAQIGADQLRAAAARNEARLWQVRARLYDEGLSREEAAGRMGVGPNQVTNLLREGKLLALDGSDGLRLPAWQFDPEARRGRLEGLERVAAAFPGRVLGLSSWMTVPNPMLAGRNPREALLDGDVALVVAAAEQLGQ